MTRSAKIHVAIKLRHGDTESDREYDTDRTPAQALELAVADVLKNPPPRRGPFTLEIAIVRATELAE